MASDFTDDVIDALGLLVQEQGPEGTPERREAAYKRFARALARFEDSAFKRGYQARQNELVANLRSVSESLRQG